MSVEGKRIPPASGTDPLRIHLSHIPHSNDADNRLRHRSACKCPQLEFVLRAKICKVKIRIC